MRKYVSKLRTFWLGEGDSPWVWMRLTGGPPFIANVCLFLVTMFVGIVGKSTSASAMGCLLFAVIFVSLVFHPYSLCPQCGEPFFDRVIRDPFRRSCIHCGKLIYSPLDTIPDGAGRAFLAKLHALVARTVHGDWSDEVALELRELVRDGALSSINPRPSDEVISFFTRPPPADERNRRITEVGAWMERIRVVEGAPTAPWSRDASATRFLTAFRALFSHYERSGASERAKRLATELLGMQRIGALAKITPEFPAAVAYFLANLERNVNSSALVVNNVREWLEAAKVRGG